MLIGLILVILIVIGIGISVLETGWAKNQIRKLIVRQANQYLTATLTIGRLEGSLFRGLELDDVRVSRDGRPLIGIDNIALSYSIRELFQSGVVLRRIRVTRPRVVAAKQPDGRWDLATLIRRESREQERTGPRRPIEIQSIEVIDGDVVLRNPLDFGATHLPTHFASLNASLSFAYYPVRWQLVFERISWIGSEPELTVKRLAGDFGRGPGGWFFNKLFVETPRSAFTVDGRIDTGTKPTSLDLHVRANRFAFQEWSGVLRGLKNIAIDAAFETSLKGPTSNVDTELRLKGSGGDIAGKFTLDTTVPGWHGAGAVDVVRLNLARWMNRPDRPSDITGHVTFDLALELGRHFPRGVYTFDGAHAMYMDYAADDVHARGQITARDALVSTATARAYGAQVTTTDGSIGIDDPFPFHFAGQVAGLDLRQVPKTVPVPRVESVLAFDYDVTGRFSRPFIAGRATFGPSTFLGARLGAGTVGSIDTLQDPLRFSGEGDVDGVSIRRFGEGLDVGWMQDPRYDGTVSGHFHVDGAGTDRATLKLTGSGRISHAELFRGTLADADVTIAIDRGTLAASYDGRIARVDPSIPFADSRFAASLTGTGRVKATVHDLLTATETRLEDYDVTGALALQQSTVRGVPLDRATLDASLREATLTIARAETAGSAIEGRATGTLAFGDELTADIQYDITRADLHELRSITRQEAAGSVSSKGHVSGPSSALHATGEASVNQLDALDVTALTLSGNYDVTVRSGEDVMTTARVTASGSFLTLFGATVENASGTVTLDGQRLGFDVNLQQAAGREGRLAGTVLVRTAESAIELEDFTATLGSVPWRLTHGDQPAVVSWNKDEIRVTPMQLAGGTGDERIRVSGTWRSDGQGALRVTASHVFLETLQGAFSRPTRYAGLLDADATIRGTRDEPIVSGTATIVDGRVERVAYDRLAARVDYSRRMFTIDARLDQGPGTWVTAAGTLPLALFDRDLPEQPIDVRIKSSAINFGLVEGLTDVIRNVSGNITVDVRVVGSSRDPHFAGGLDLAGAAFLVAATGSSYRNVRASIGLSTDKLTVESFHAEDSGGDALDLRGSLGTHELRVGDVNINANARRFEVLRNALGRIELDAALQIRGRFETPRVVGTVTLANSELKVDEILERTLFQPYATEQTAITEVDAIAALNPWDRLGLDVALHVPNTLRLTGENVQVAPGTPLGLGDINLRVAGDVYLFKDPQQPMYVNGSFDSVSGTYAFQGRRFDVIPTSSINFRGDLNPEIYVTVTRVISGVETRVSILGSLRQPELQLASTPPLDQSDILSLIVFGTSTNQLTSAQQQQLVARAGALAAGFLATPILSAIENEIGLDILEVDPEGEFGIGPRVTVGEEIAPGLVARFSRQFGPEPYDEATVEYYLSRILRLRATFSDAQTLVSRSPFRRVERAGIDLLFFFSF